MNQDKKMDQKPSTRAASRMRTWLTSISILVVLTAAALFLLPRFINTPSVRQKIQTAITERIDGQVDFQAIDLSYFPRPAIELHQVSLNIPDQVQGTIGVLRLAPALEPILRGELRLARLELDAPLLNVQLPEQQATKSPPQPYTFATLEKQLVSVLDSSVGTASRLKLQVEDARLTISQKGKKQLEIEGLALQFTVSETDPHSASGHLQTTITQMSLYRKGPQEMVRNASIDCTMQMTHDSLTVSLERLAIIEPSLELTGDLVLAKDSPAFTVNLSSSNINVNATRRNVLALAGDTPPARDIFDYLRGGQVPQISFASAGDSLAALLDINNMVIKGQLQEGMVSIPAIKLDLTEVNGKVIVSKGVLQATGVSTRLEGSTGRDGSLQVGLAKDNDLFQLDLTLSANLSEIATILHRVVEDPVFIAELEKITNVQGSSNARLVLGDSLQDLNATVEASDLKFSANYQRIPLPITITQGQATVSKELIAFDKLSGNLGNSHFADISFQVHREENTSLDITSGSLELVTAELFPWLASLEALRDQLKDIRRLQGQIDVSTLKFAGPLDRPLEGKYTVTGKVQGLAIETSLFPSSISLARGEIAIDNRQLAVTELHTATQDASLIVTGSIKGLPLQLTQLNLELDGHMGPKSVQWLSDKVKLPQDYAVRTPLDIRGARISWQPDVTVSFKGAVAVDNGPKIVADVDYRPNRLQVHQLTIKDQYSDASLVLDRKNNQNDYSFTGKLQEQTLHNLFVKNPFSGGQIAGNMDIVVPRSRTSRIQAQGQLTGKNFPIPLPSGDKVDIEQVTLQADGSNITADITKLTWKELIWQPIQGTVDLSRNQADIWLTEARLCGIDSPGSLSIAGDNVLLNTTLEAKGLDVDTSYTCLTRGHVKMTGTLDLASQVTARGKMDQLLTDLQGPLKVTFRHGLIKKDQLLSLLLEVLNVTEIVRGRLPSLRGNGFAYKKIDIKGRFHRGKLIIEKFYMDGDTLDVVGKGKIHLQKKTLNIQLLASPFKTANSIIKHIPGLNYLMNDSLVSIPISVTGTISEPKVRVMSPPSIAHSLVDLAKRIVTAPFKLLEEIDPWSKDK